MLLDQSNEASWVFPAMKSTIHFLSSPQCLLDQTQVQKPILVVVTGQMPVTVWSAQMAISQITTSGRSLIYSTKIVGPRMEPWVTPELTGYSCGNIPSRTTWSHLLLTKEEIRPNKYLTWNSVRLKFVKTSMPNPVKSPGYIKCYSLSSLITIKRASNSIT